MNSLFRPSIAFGGLVSLAFAADSQSLISNFTFGAFPAGSGSAWVTAQSEGGSGVSRLDLAVEAGVARVTNVVSGKFPTDIEAIHDYIFQDLTGERRMLHGLALDGGLWLPAYSPSVSLGTVPSGFLRVSENGSSVRDSLSWSGLADARLAGLSGAAVLNDQVWAAFGVAGLGVADLETGSPGRTWKLYTLKADAVADSAMVCQVPGICDQTARDTSGVLSALALTAEEDSLWLGTAKGLWRGLPGHFRKVASAGLDTERVTGLWLAPDGRLLVETSLRINDRTRSRLLIRTAPGQDFASVRFRDSTGKLLDIYDSLDASITGVAWLAKGAILAPSRIEGQFYGVLKMDSTNNFVYNTSEEGYDFSEWLLGPENGAMESKVSVSGATTVTVGTDTVVVITTYGGGVSLTADQGETWTIFANRTAVKGGLSEVRMVPSVLRLNDWSSVVAYRLDADAKVTIEIFSYDMLKVRTLIKNAQRYQDPVRSSDPRVDIWDGTDDHGARVGVGLYYVKVTSGSKTTWGKVMNLVGKQ